MDIGKSFIGLLFSLISLLRSCEGKIGCIDPAGKYVDWFIVYKIPAIHSSSHPMVREGLGHVYLDASSPKWKLSDVSLNSSSDNAVANTLAQIYHNYKSSNITYILYNDETPEKNTSVTYGHTKGDISFDKDSGYWLVHSVPRFPPYVKTSYSYPPTGTRYGQTFLCLTLPYKTLDTIGQQLLYTYPQIYDSNFPDAFVKENPTIDQVLKGKHVDKEPWQHQTTLQTVGGQKFESFAKFTKFGADLYDAWVAPTLQTGLLVESWQNGGKDLPSNCSADFKVHNIKELKITDEEFKDSKDHAKWAVSTEPGNEWVCVGDINRQEEQSKRAGGTVCVHIVDVWTTFNSSIVSIEPCQVRKKSYFSKYNLNTVIKVV